MGRDSFTAVFYIRFSNVLGSGFTASIRREEIYFSSYRTKKMESHYQEMRSEWSVLRILSHLSGVNITHYCIHHCKICDENSSSRKHLFFAKHNIYIFSAIGRITSSVGVATCQLCHILCILKLFSKSDNHGYWLSDCVQGFCKSSRSCYNGGLSSTNK